MEYLYRYEETVYSLGLDQFDDPLPGYDLKLNLLEYTIIKRTPKGAWISYYAFPTPLYESDKKFVLLTAKKQFACETKEKALESFIYRKKRQINILKSKLEIAQQALKLAENQKE